MSKSHLPGRPKLDVTDYEGYETKTIFNDLFISSNRREIIGIGPPLVNLKHALLPIKLSLLNDEGAIDVSLPHRYSEHDRVSIHRFKLPESHVGQTSLRINCDFSDELTVELNIVASPLKNVDMQFTTLQKNNPANWISDWLIYCYGLGVNRVLLYDNASNNIGDVERMLESLEIDMEIVLIDWPFPYGPLRSYYNQFCQATQNNHAHLFFGQAKWMGHFDVDEYLVSSGHMTLKETLASLADYVGLLRFDSYWVHDVGGKRDGNISVRDLAFRDRTARGRAHKYLMKPRAHRLAKTHNGQLKLGWLRQSIKSTEWSFLHYRPLTTDWRGGTVRRNIVPLDLQVHREDRRVIEWFAENEMTVSG